jgi:electron transfer flavoprotein alpha subunit
MSGTLVIAEHLQGQVGEVTGELVSAATELGAPVTVAVIAAEPGPLLDAADLDGVDEIVAVRAGGQEFEVDTYTEALATLVAQRQPDVVLLGFTVNSMSYGPSVAARLGLGFASDVFALSSSGGAGTGSESIVATRAFYGSKVHAEVVFEGVPAVVLLLRRTVWPAAGPSGTAVRSELEIATAPPRARHVEFVEAPAADIDITTADFLLSIGRGIGDRDNLERFSALADSMGAVLSVSRPLVDAGWMPSARQVGQSGKTVKPKVYLAFGISGAVQHLAGMKGSGTIIAVNTDPEAAIFSVAHYGAVTDLFDVADELEKLFSGT